MALSLTQYVQHATEVFPFYIQRTIKCYKVIHVIEKVFMWCTERTVLQLRRNSKILNKRCSCDTKNRTPPLVHLLLNVVLTWFWNWIQYFATYSFFFFFYKYFVTESFFIW